MPIDAARKMKRIEIIGQKVPGQKDYLPRYFQEYRGKWPVAPVGSAPMGRGKTTPAPTEILQILPCLWRMASATIEI